MKIKDRASDFSFSLLQKGKNIFSGSFSKETEIQALSSELKDLPPITKNTFLTLISNSQLKRKISLPPQDALCAKITSYAYLDPEKRPYQIGDFYLEPMYNSLFHCIYLNHKKKICII